MFIADDEWWPIYYIMSIVFIGYFPSFCQTLWSNAQYCMIRIISPLNYFVPYSYLIIFYLACWYCFCRPIIHTRMPVVYFSACVYKYVICMRPCVYLCTNVRVYACYYLFSPKTRELHFYLLTLVFDIEYHLYESQKYVFFSFISIFLYIVYLYFIKNDEIKLWNWSPVNFPHKSQWRGALIFSLICAWINGWVNNREAGDLRRHHLYYDVTLVIKVSMITVVIGLANGVAFGRWNNQLWAIMKRHFSDHKTQRYSKTSPIILATLTTRLIHYAWTFGCFVQSKTPYHQLFMI